MTEIDILAQQWRTNRVTDYAVEKGLARIASGMGLDVRAVRNVFHKACKEGAGKPYNGPVDFRKTYQGETADDRAIAR